MSIRRIVYVVDGFPKVSETFVAGEVAEVIRRGIDVRILSIRPAGEGPVHQVVTRARLIERTCYDRDAFDDVIRGFGPDLIHAHFARGATETARELSARHTVPFTFTAHGYDVWRKPPADLGARVNAARAVVTVSQANADELTGRFDVDRGRLHVIPCGIDIDLFRPGDPGAAPPLVLAVARLRPVKNLELLLRALARVRDAGFTFMCRIVGEGPQRTDLETLRDDLGLTGIVDMPGALSQDEVRREWQRAAAGVLTSASEGMPIALMEAAACGVPVVATRVGGVAELVADGETGYVVPSGDAAAVARALSELLAAPELRARMGRAARARAVERFSVERQVDALVRVWEETVAPTSQAA